MASPVSSSTSRCQGWCSEFAELDPAAGQRIEPLGRRARPAHQEHLAVAEDRGADRDLGMGGLDDRRHDFDRPGSIRHDGVDVGFRAAIDDAAAGRDQRLDPEGGLFGEAARVVSFSTSRMAEPTAVRIEVMVVGEVVELGAHVRDRLSHRPRWPDPVP